MELFYFLSFALGWVWLPIVLLLLWGVRRVVRTHSTGGPRPPDLPLASQALDTFMQLIERWCAEGRLDQPTATLLSQLLLEERSLVAPLSTGATMPAVASASPQPPVAQPAAPSAPDATVAAPREAWSERLGAVLLAMRTRQTLLGLGAFLLVLSALVLVVFNWGSFLPLAQFALLAGIAAGVWAGGIWAERAWPHVRAGAGLQMTASMLTPMVLFSLSRPGLLEAEARFGWLITSLVCAAGYGLAAYWLRRRLFVYAAYLALLSATAAAALLYAPQQLAPLMLLALALPIAADPWLRRAEPGLAKGPRMIGLVGMPVTLALAAVGAAFQLIDVDTLAVTLHIGLLCALLAALTLEHESRARQIARWAAAALPLPALAATLVALAASQLWWGLSFALLAATILGAGYWLERRQWPGGLPSYLSAGLAAALAMLPIANDSLASRVALPILIAAAASLAPAAARRRFSMLSDQGRANLGAAGLAAAGLLAWLWEVRLLETLEWTEAQRGLALVPLAAVLFLAAGRGPGRMHRLNELALQAIGLLTAATSWLVMFDSDLGPLWSAALASIWLWQALATRGALWRFMLPGQSALTIWLALLNRPGFQALEHTVGLLLALATSYTLGSWLLEWRGRPGWRTPLMVWGALLGLLALAVLVLVLLTTMLYSGLVLGWQALALVWLAGLFALASVRWRGRWLGTPGGTLLAIAALLAYHEGFYTGWEPASADLVYALCVTGYGLVAIGRLVRRVAPAYGLPYELLSYPIVMLAPIAAVDPEHICLTWSALAMLSVLAARFYRMPWALVPALLCADVALLGGAAWIKPGGRIADAGPLLLAATWLHAGLGYWLHRVSRLATQSWWPGTPTRSSYLAACLTAAAALLLASGASQVFALVALGLALLCATLATLEASEPPAWGALALLVIGGATLADLAGMQPAWRCAWGVVAALGLMLLGWLLAKANSTHTAVWRRPLLYGPQLLGAGLTLLLGPSAYIGLAPITFALATLSLIAATAGVRMRSVDYAYVASGLLLGAGLCQLYSWGFRQPQWFTVPAGIYLLALAAAMRRFQGRVRASRMLEGGAVPMLLGVAFVEALMAGPAGGSAATAWLCLEALLILGYGMLARLRVPFVEGAAFFVAGAIWFSAGPLLSMNRWALVGSVGLLMIATYVLLERRSNQLAQLGRTLVERVGGWA